MFTDLVYYEICVSMSERKGYCRVPDKKVHNTEEPRNVFHIFEVL